MTSVLVHQGWCGHECVELSISVLIPLISLLGLFPGSIFSVTDQSLFSWGLVRYFWEPYNLRLAIGAHSFCIISSCGEAGMTIDSFCSATGKVRLDWVLWQSNISLCLIISTTAGDDIGGIKWQAWEKKTQKNVLKIKQYLIPLMRLTSSIPKFYILHLFFVVI